jgi:hypothetical protein
MAKKRKTRREKIITQLRRELERQKEKTVTPTTKSPVRQEAISPQPQIEPQQARPEKKADVSIFFYDPRLVKKDLAKTLILALVAISLEVMLYFYLR